MYRIGKKYLSNTYDLLGKIIENDDTCVSELRTDDNEYACYFCGKRIEGRKLIITEKGKDSMGNDTVSRYLSHLACYVEKIASLN